MCMCVGMRKERYTKGKEEENKERERVEQMLHLAVSLLFPLWPGVMEG